MDSMGFPVFQAFRAEVLHWLPDARVGRGLLKSVMPGPALFMD